MKLYDSIINPLLLVRRINISVCNLITDDKSKDKIICEQLDLFSDIENNVINKEIELNDEKEERKVQNTILSLKNKYGKNAIIRGMNLEEGATTIQRNRQVGGHKA